MELKKYINVDTVLVLSLAIVVLVYLYLEWKYSHWKRRGVPHLQATSIIFGNVKQLFFSKESEKSTYEYIYNYRKGEPIIGYYEFQNPVLMVRDLDLAKQVLSQKFHNFRDQRFAVSPRVDPIMAMNPFSRTYHDSWKASRAVLTPGLTQGKLRSYPQVFIKPFRDLCKFIDESNGDIELMDLSKRVSCDVVASWGWGVEGNACSKVDSPIYATFKDMTLEGYSLDLMVVNKLISRIMGYRMFSESQTAFFTDLTRKCLDASGGTNSSPCLLQISAQAISICDEFDTSNKENFIKEVTAGLCTFFLDGFSTTSSMLGALLYELMLNRDVQSKLREEIKELDNNLTVENVEKLEYLDMVLSDILRIRTPFHYLGRICTEKCTLGPVECQPGDDVIIPVSAIHMDPDYFPNPEQFNPENFSAENRKKRHPLTSLSFGLGPRMCLGLNFAKIFMKMIVSSLINDYEIVAPKNYPSEPVRFNRSKAFVQYIDQVLYARFEKL
uniref:Cytochrome P450 CYP418A2 n=1 Tax=Sogatella furcifera TaxID=113103 RepID=A0A1Q1NKZ0_SOGFU|nr:cytochrome P450 CYP418A2 [Sogatella furcifera]